MNAIPDAITQALAAFAPPEPSLVDRLDQTRAMLQKLRDAKIITDDEFRTALRQITIGEPIKPSLIVPCPACDGGWRDTANGVVMCGQCRGSGQRATNGGEP